MGTVVELRPNEKDEVTRSIGMIIALGAWAMMFGALFFMYFGLRARSLMWPPPGIPPLPPARRAINTAVLLASSAALLLGIRALRRGRRNGLAAWVGAAIALGAGFIALQVVVWKDLWNEGLLPSTGAYGSVFYGLTALHAAHVLAGLGVLVVILVRALSGTYTEHNVGRVRVAAMFWHFVDAVWVLMYLALYLY